MGTFFSFIIDIFGIVLSILGLWISIVSVADKKSVERVFNIIYKYFQNQQNFPLTKIQNKKSITFSEFPLEEVVENKPKNAMFKYLFILVGLIFISIILIKAPHIQQLQNESETLPVNIEWESSGGMNVLSLFWMYVLLFSFVGAMRGWAKELFVIFGSTLALTINLLLSKYFPIVKDLHDDSISLFWIQSIILIIFVYFGYQMVVSIQHLAAKSVREKFQDILFGVITGGLNGYLIAGSILFYFHKAGYPYKNIIAPPVDTSFFEIINRLMVQMPPSLFGEPAIYFILFVMLIFVFIVYI